MRRSSHTVSRPLGHSLQSTAGLCKGIPRKTAWGPLQKTLALTASPLAVSTFTQSPHPHPFQVILKVASSADPSSPARGRRWRAAQSHSGCEGCGAESRMSPKPCTPPRARANLQAKPAPTHPHFTQGMFGWRPGLLLHPLISFPAAPILLLLDRLLGQGGGHNLVRERERTSHTRLLLKPFFWSSPAPVNSMLVGQVPFLPASCSAYMPPPPPLGHCSPGSSVIIPHTVKLL